MEILGNFIPLDRRIAVSEGRELPADTRGVGLFADVSGFTATTERLAEDLGAHRAAEEITLNLNRLYERLVDEVHSHRGIVISFSGDAISCWFADDDGSRAVSCAVFMNDAVGRFGVIHSPVGSSEPVNIKIAVSRGDGRRLVVGKPTIQRLDVVLSDVFGVVSAIEHQLNGGEIGVGAKIVNTLGSRLRIIEWRQCPDDAEFAVVNAIIPLEPSTSFPTLPALDQETGKMWLLPPVYERVRRDSSFIAELRSAAAVFVSFRLDDQERKSEVHFENFVNLTQSVLFRYEGLLQQIMLGEKGSYLYGTIGVPVSHEDDATRAVAASIELKKVVSKLDFVHYVKIGVAYGDMYAGIYGGTNRCTFGVIGRDVNIAARLMEEASENEVLVTGRVKRLAESKFDLSSVGSVRLKGIKIPIEVFSAAERRSLRDEFRLNFRFSEYNLVGRNSEKHAIVDAIRVLEKAGNETLVFAGDAGIGKSRILEYAVKQALSHGIYVYYTECDAFEKNTPYFPWQEILRDVFDLRESADVQSLQQHIIDWLVDDDELLEQLPLLNDILGTDFPENDITSQQKEEIRAANTRQFIVNLIARKQRRRIGSVLILDDVHWMDSASWQLLLEIKKSGLPCIQMLATRAVEEAHHVLSESNDLHDVRYFHIDELPVDEARAIMVQCLDVENVSANLTDFVLGRSGGNPFFCRELTYMLRDRDLLLTRNGYCDLDRARMVTACETLPDSVHSVVISRLDQLLPFEQAILKTASAIGKTFSLSVLHGVHVPATNEGRIRESLTSMAGDDILKIESDDSGGTVSFRHEVLRQAAYDMMLFLHRRELHSRIAGWYESNRPENSIRFSVLGHHYELAGENNKAVKYYSRAGAEALRKYANQEAVELFCAAVSILDRSKLDVERHIRPTLELSIGHAFVNSLRNSDGMKHLEAGLLLMDRTIPRSRVSRLFAILRQFIKQIYLRFVQMRHRLDVSSRDREPLLAAARAYESLTEVYYFSKQTELTLYAMLSALNLAESAGPSPELYRGYVTAGIILGFVPLHKAAISYINRALEGVRGIRDLPAIAYVDMAASLYFIGICDWNRAEDLLSEAIDISTRIGDSEKQDICSLNLSYSRLLKGDPRAALAIAEVYCRAEENGMTKTLSVRITSSELRAICLLRLGRVDDAIECLESLPALFQHESVVFNESDQIVMYGLLGLAYLRRNEIEKAIGAASVALAYSEDVTSDNFGYFWGFAGMADVFISVWELNTESMEWKKKTRISMKRFRAFSRVFKIGLPRLEILNGRIQSIYANTTRARMYWSRAVEHAKAYMLPYEQANAEYEIGVHLNHEDPQRDKHLTEAERLFDFPLDLLGGRHK